MSSLSQNFIFKVSNGFLSILEVLEGFPGSIIFRISFPFDKIFSTFVSDSLVKDLFNLIFFLVIDNDRRYWLRCTERIFVAWVRLEGFQQ